MGWRNPRITDDECYGFVDEFIRAVETVDGLGSLKTSHKNAMPLTNRYRNEIL